MVVRWPSHVARKPEVSRGAKTCVETHQSHGLGEALLARAEREARVSRCRHLVLLVTKTNRRARVFYERHGYAHVGDLAGFVRPGIAESLYLKSWRA